METFKLSLLDDNEFFLELFRRQLLTHASFLEITKNYKIEIQAFSDWSRFFETLAILPDLLYLDFNLGHGFNAFGVIEELRKADHMPPIAIITERDNISKHAESYMEHVECIMRKDTYLIPRACLFLEDAVDQWEKTGGYAYGS